MMIKNQFLDLVKKTKITLWGTKQLIVAAPKETSLLSVLIFLQGIVPACSLFIVQMIIDWILSPAFGNWIAPLSLLTAWGGMLALGTIVSPIISVIRIHLNEKVLTHCNVLLMEKANSIDSLAAFENPQLYDQMQFLKNESARRPLIFVFIMTGLIKDLITLTSILIVISTISAWIPLFIFIACIPHAISTYWFEKQTWTDVLFRGPEARRLAWFSSLTMDERFSKEIRLFGFGDFLVSEYKKLARRFHEAFSTERWQKSCGFISLSLLSVLGNIGIFAFVVIHAKQGYLSTGAVVMALQALVMTQFELNGLIQDFGMLAQTMLFFEKFNQFLTTNFCFLISEKNITIPRSFPEKEIRFENVSFSYPDGRKVLSKVSFSIPVRKKIAIVGENGAGKSTLIKLLTRFYDPTEGRILIDGIDLKNIDIKTWRDTLSVVFQDFGQYHLSAKENIGISRSSFDLKDIAHAAKQGGFDAVAEKLPQGFDSLLGKEFGGTSLSSGEWQKLAMSRAFFRNANILILDEPTAALDPKSEHEVFQKFSENTENKTTFFITHRLGSVRMADWILVLKNGKLIEEGHHEELVSKKEGEYAYLFSLQASRYSYKILIP
jgi:ATP-binding cassette, subfamily B, bacterial